MRPREYFTLGFGSIIGVGWMILIDDWLNRGGPAGAMLGFLIGGIALIPVALAYGQLAGRMPLAASEVAYTAAVFPQAVSFATGWAMTLAYLIVCPFEAVAIGRIAAYAFPQINTVELYRVGDYPVYLPPLVLGLGLTAAITIVNYFGVHISALFQNVTTFGLLAVFAIFSTLGFFRGSPANLPPLFADDTGWDGALVSTLVVLQIVPYFLTGFETIPKCSEEAAADVDPRSFTWVVLLALGVATFFYVIVIGVVALLEPWRRLVEQPFATVVAFRRAFGWEWLVRLIMLGALLSLLKVFNGNFLAATRLLYAMGQRQLLGARLGTVDQQFQTPTVAIVAVGGFTAAASLLGRAVLVPISEVGSLAGALGWLATCLALCWGAGGIRSTTARMVGWSGALVSAALVLIAASGFGIYHVLALIGWVVLGCVLWIQQRIQQA
jgi:amino acid transporter